MKHTREQLENMSDEEINYALADSLYENPRNCIHMGFDYEDWAVIMPLAVKYGISIFAPESSDFMWNCIDNSGVADVYDKSPQRAITCCLLMMEIGE